LISYILTDIEGTTTPITFVHDVLFPFAYKRLPEFVKNFKNNPDVKKCLKDTIDTVAEENGKTISEDEAIETLLLWIKTDRKHPALKALQGHIWQEGYESGSYTSEVYPDVLPNVKLWTKKGQKVGIYSSGSIQAQKLLFGHTPNGNMNPLLSDYFDTGVGGKKEEQSYKNIALQLKLDPDQIVFLSDIEAELIAAKKTGMQTVQLVRDGTTPSKLFPNCKDFDEVAEFIRNQSGH
jgi:enolase-phosphatase E1